MDYDAEGDELGASEGSCEADEEERSVSDSARALGWKHLDDSSEVFEEECCLPLGSDTTSSTDPCPGLIEGTTLRRGNVGLSMSLCDRSEGLGERRDRELKLAEVFEEEHDGPRVSGRARRSRSAHHPEKRRHWRS